MECSVLGDICFPTVLCFVLFEQLNISMHGAETLTRPYRKSRQVIRVEASTAAEGLIAGQNVWILQQRQLSRGQSFTQLLSFLVRPSLPVYDCIQQAFGRDSPLCG